MRFCGIKAVNSPSTHPQGPGKLLHFLKKENGVKFKHCYCVKCGLWPLITKRFPRGTLPDTHRVQGSSSCFVPSRLLVLVEKSPQTWPLPGLMDVSLHEITVLVSAQPGTRRNAMRFYFRSKNSRSSRKSDVSGRPSPEREWSPGVFRTELEQGQPDPSGEEPRLLSYVLSELKLPSWWRDVFARKEHIHGKA